MPLKLSVNYYNKNEAELFEEYENYESINEMVGKDITISKDEFLSYMMFTEQAEEIGFRTYGDLKDRVQHRLGDIDEYLDFSENSIKAGKSSERLSSAGITERIGVSLGLNVINKLHDLTEADWAITPNIYKDGKRTKDFDYHIEMASDGKRFIQVENKGSINDDNTKKSPSVSNHYKSIKGKKESILKREKNDKIERYHNIYYGTIGVLDNENTAKVWLVDPDPYHINWNPKKYKLISRLSYYAKLFQEADIHKSIQKDLKERIEEIVNSDNYESFDNKPLKISDSVLRRPGQAKFLASINYGESVGSFFFVKTKKGIQAFLIVIPKALIKIIASQDFEKILNYEYKNDEMNDKVTVELSFKLSSFSDGFENSNLKFVLDEKKKRYHYQMYQKISHTTSGRIFGIIKSNNN